MAIMQEIRSIDWKIYWLTGINVLEIKKKKFRGEKGDEREKDFVRFSEGLLNLGIFEDYDERKGGEWLCLNIVIERRCSNPEIYFFNFGVSSSDSALIYLNFTILIIVFNPKYISSFRF